MVRSDILLALKNALERGENIEQAKQSLVNSGYPLEDIEEAINIISGQQVEYPEIQEVKKSNANETGTISAAVQNAAQKEKTSIFKKIMADKTLFLLILVFIVLAIGAVASFFLIKK